MFYVLRVTIDTMKTVGVIGGSGLYEMDGLTDVEFVAVDTPWGEPSDELVRGMLGGTQMYFLPRHGRGHTLMPGEINYRANVYALKKVGVEWVISVSAVGSMKEEIEPGHVVIPDQFYDNTRGRHSTFFGGGVVAHVSMADPVCPILSDVLYRSALEVGATVHKGGTYMCMEGPQFSSRAESRVYRQWGVDVIGMTNMPEAKLVREAEMGYATLALSTDYDCWHDDHDDVTVEDILKTLMSNVELSKRIIAEAVPRIPASTDKGTIWANALEHAIITSRDSISPEARQRLGLLIGRYV